MVCVAGQKLPGLSTIWLAMAGVPCLAMASVGCTCMSWQIHDHQMVWSMTIEGLKIDDAIPWRQRGAPSITIEGLKIWLQKRCSQEIPHGGNEGNLTKATFTTMSGRQPCVGSRKRRRERRWQMPHGLRLRFAEGSDVQGTGFHICGSYGLSEISLSLQLKPPLYPYPYTPHLPSPRHL